MKPATRECSKNFKENLKKDYHEIQIMIKNSSDISWKLCEEELLSTFSDYGLIIKQEKGVSSWCNG